MDTDDLMQFRFDRPLSLPLRLVGIAPGTSWLRWGPHDLDVRFGPWRVRTPLDNVAEARLSGPLSLWKGLGVRLSLADRGLTFGSSTSGGVCLLFRTPVTGIDPFGLLRHPGLTVTLAEPAQLLLKAQGQHPGR